ncbi:MAG TPA: tripartite tricarboxylate transporter substrate-binding protein [Sphaerochaeta sp.]|nr:tripartite tricarboxylate transporter substrate-binding protein [Sphaerochaeta sp.]
MKKFLTVSLFLVLAASMVFAAGATEATKATKIWPKNNAVLTVGFGAGGGTDTAVRPVIAEMEKYLGETINVVNQAGGASAVAATNVLAKAHDGYNLFATGSGAFAGFGVNGTSDSTWVDWASFHPYSGPAAIIVPVKSDINTLDDLFKYLSKGKQNFAIGSFGNGPHVQIEAILKIAGVPTPNYTTLGACRDVGISIIAGDSAAGIGSFSSLIDLANAGQIKVLCVTTADPWVLDNGTVIPSITTLLKGAETVPQLCETWPIMIPRDVPQNILDKLTEAFNYALSTPAVKKYASDMAFNIVAYTGEDADRFMAIATSGYAWTQYDAGLVQISPETLGIPRMENFDWAVEKQKLNK